MIGTPDTATTAAPAGAGTRRDRLERLQGAGVYIAIALVLLPLVVTLVSLAGAHWHPSSDDAIEVLRIRDVGGSHTPLVGMDSRLRWSHPGPVVFWALAPFRWVAGDTGILLGVAVLNGAALTGALLLARRRGGLQLVVLVGVAMLILMRALGQTTLIDPWVPWVAVVPFFLYLMLAWSVADGDLFALPLLVVVGSFSAQSYVGYLPLVVLVGLATLALMWLRSRADPKIGGRPLGRAALIAAAAGIIMWLPPIIQQFTGSPGNLGEIIEYSRDPPEEFFGFAGGFGLLGKELSLPGPWIGGNDTSALGYVFTGGTGAGLLLLAAVALAGWIAWTRRASATRFACLMFVTAWFGVFSGARLTGAPGPYQVRWWWVIAALLWCSLLWSLWSRFGSDRFAPVVTGAGAVAMAVLSLVVAVDAVPARVPGQQFSDAIAVLGRESASQLSRDQRYLVNWVDTRDFGAIGNGMYLDLLARGLDVDVGTGLAKAFGSWRAADPAEVDRVITVVGGDSFADYTPRAGAVRIALYDPLDPPARARADELEAAIRAKVGPGAATKPGAVDTVFGRAALRQAGVDDATINELRGLRRNGVPYAVYSAPA